MLGYDSAYDACHNKLLIFWTLSFNIPIVNSHDQWCTLLFTLLEAPPFSVPLSMLNVTSLIFEGL